MTDTAKQDPVKTSAATAAPKRCPVCGKAAVEALTPFCSKRCADVDLHRWLGGVYAVPVAEDTADKE